MAHIWVHIVHSHHHHLFALVKKKSFNLQVKVMARRTTRLIKEATLAVINK